LLLAVVVVEVLLTQFQMAAVLVLVVLDLVLVLLFHQVQLIQLQWVLVERQTHKEQIQYFHLSILLAVVKVDRELVLAEAADQVVAVMEMLLIKLVATGILLQQVHLKETMVALEH
jgi:hypothetical protein